MNNNAQVTERVQNSGGFASKNAAETAIQQVLLSIKELAKEKGKVTFGGYGTFTVKTRPARTGRNPQNGATIEIPAKEVFSFKASK